MRARNPAPPARHGFTVLELMLSVAIMTVLVIALYTVFDQTQKALRGTMSQVDVLESARATGDLLARDFESAVPVETRKGDIDLTSLAVAVSPVSVGVGLQGLDTTGEALMVTALQDIFFVTRRNDTWTAIGYWVGPANTNQLGEPLSCGRLYRWSYATNHTAFGYTNLLARFNGPERLLTSQPVMDGVVQFRVLAYDADGKPLRSTLFTNTPPKLRPWFADPVRNTETAYWFRQLTVPEFPGIPYTIPRFPAALELELGVLEPQVFTRFAAIPVAAEARRFLGRQAGNIHLFRQRIPLRNAPPF